MDSADLSAVRGDADGAGDLMLADLIEDAEMLEGMPCSDETWSQLLALIRYVADDATTALVEDRTWNSIRLSNDVASIDVLHHGQLVNIYPTNTTDLDSLQPTLDRLRAVGFRVFFSGTLRELER